MSPLRAYCQSDLTSGIVEFQCRTPAATGANVVNTGFQDALLHQIPLCCAADPQPLPELRCANPFTTEHR